MNTKIKQVKVRATTIINKSHPEWGKFGIMEDTGEWLVIRNRAGSSVLFYSEFEKFWEIVKS